MSDPWTARRPGTTGGEAAHDDVRARSGSPVSTVHGTTPADGAPAQVTPAQVAPAQVTPAQVAPAQVTPAQVTPAPTTAEDAAPAATPSTGAAPAATPEGPAAAPPTDAPRTEVPSDGETAPVHRSRHHVARRRRLRWALVVLLVLLLLASAAAAVYLYRTTEAWQARSEEYLTSSQDLGQELATTRATLSGAQAELDAVRAQLATAQERIVQLADEKAQLGDDREVQRQLVDYQQRVSSAAGQVALALDQCIQGQNQLIGYLKQADQYDPADIERFGSDVQALCQAATDANTALQRELAP